MQVGRILYQSMLWRGLYYLSAFVVNILIARHFQAAISGEIYYLSSIYSMAVLFVSFSIESGIVFYAAKNEIAPGKLLNFSVLWSLVTGILTFCIMCFFVKGSFSAGHSSLLLVSSVTFICGNLLITYCTGLFYARNNFILPNLISIIINLALVLLLPYNGIALIHGINDANFFLLYFSSFLLQGIVLAIAVQLKYVHAKFISFLTMAEFRILFRYCAMAYAANIIFFFVYRVDYWFVERYCTPEALGNYIQVSKLGQLFFILPTILASAVFPLTAGGQKETVNGFLKMLSSGILLLYLVACGVLVLCGSWLFPFVFGKSFSGMYQPFLFLIPGILSLSGLHTLTAYYAGKNRIRVNITGSLLALAVILTGDSIFIPRYGINAAALTSSIGYIFYQGYVLWVFKNEYQTSVSGFFIFKLSDWQNIKQGISQLRKRDKQNQ
jgi:O-antigen/teichoic acid export membrane protein